MYKLIMFIFGIMVSTSAMARDVYVDDYYRKDGTYVPAHHRSQADGNPWNNYSTTGNVNPYTGEQGTVNPKTNTRSSFGYINPDYPGADKYNEQVKRTRRTSGL